MSYGTEAQVDATLARQTHYFALMMFSDMEGHMTCSKATISGFQHPGSLGEERPSRRTLRKKFILMTKGPWLIILFLLQQLVLYVRVFKSKIRPRTRGAAVVDKDHVKACGSSASFRGPEVETHHREAPTHK